MEQVFFNVPLSKLEPIFKKWIKEAQVEIQFSEGSLQKATEKILTVEEAAEFLNLKASTIYRKVSRGELPVMKCAKRVYFSNIQLMEYLKGRKHKTNQELEENANHYLESQKMKNHEKNQSY